jgi:hypothetical protein
MRRDAGKPQHDLAALASLLLSEESPELRRLRDRIEALMIDPAPGDAQLPYIRNLAAAVAAHHPPLDADWVLMLTTADVQNGLVDDDVTQAH